MRRATLVLVAITLALSGVSAQQQQTPQKPPPPARSGGAPAAATANPLVTSMKFGYDTFKGFLIKAAEQMKEADYAFKPAGTAPEVRTFGQIIGHLADANAGLCAGASGMTPPATIKDAEHTLKTKAELQKALGEAFAF